MRSRLPAGLKSSLPRLVLVGTLFTVWCACARAQVGAPVATLPMPAPVVSPIPPTLLDQGFRQMYDLDFTGAQSDFARWQVEHPSDAMGYVAEAAGLIFSEFNRLGVLESQFFVDDKAWERRPKLSPDPAIKARFDAALDHAENLARAQATKNPNDKNALFALAGCYGLRADYAALIEKRNLPSLSYAKQSSQWADKLLALDPQYYDAYIATGVGKYVIGTQAAPVRWLLRLGGYAGDRDGGIQDLQLAAEHGRYLAPFARILLAIAYLRAKDKPRARAVIASLRQDFPQNPLFAREMARLGGN